MFYITNKEIVMKSVVLRMYPVVIISWLGILVYSNSFNSSFHFDDSIFIVDNSSIRNIHDIDNIWKFYPCRFLTFLTLAINYHFGQLNLLGYHLFNLGIHLFCAVLVWWLMRLTLSTPLMRDNKILAHQQGMALLAGLIFVSHPIQTEAVTYIWQRAASLACMFYLSAICFFVKSRLYQDKVSDADLCKTYYFLSILAIACAMFSKENTISLPLMILLYDYTFFGLKKDIFFQRHLLLLFMMLVIPLTMLITHSSQAQEVKGIAQATGGISPLHYFLSQIRVMMTYLRLIFIPVNLNFDYDFPVYQSIFEAPVFLSLCILMMVIFFALQLLVKYRLVFFGIFWYFLSLCPESSFLPQKDLVAEHRLYLPLVGYIFFLTSGLFYFFGKKSIQGVYIILGLVLLLNSFLTYQRNNIWKNEITLWEDTVKKSPLKARPYNNLGTALAQEGQLGPAKLNFLKAIALDPRYPDAYYNLGNINRDQGNFSKAIANYNQAIDLNPRYELAYNNRGYVFFKQGNYSQSLLDFDEAIKLNPADPGLYNNRAMAYGHLRK